jgi:hypothetical protein
VNRGFPVMSIEAHGNVAPTDTRTSRVVESNVRRSAAPLVGAHLNLASPDSIESPLVKANVSDAEGKPSPAGTQKRGGFDAHVNLASTETETSRVVESNARPGSAVPLISAHGNLASADSMKSPLAEANVRDAKVKRSTADTQKRGAFRCPRQPGVNGRPERRHRRRSWQRGVNGRRGALRNCNLSA